MAKDGKSNVAGKRLEVPRDRGTWGWGYTGTVDVIKDLECGTVGTDH